MREFRRNAEEIEALLSRAKYVDNRGESIVHVAMTPILERLEKLNGTWLEMDDTAIQRELQEIAQMLEKIESESGT